MVPLPLLVTIVCALGLLGTLFKAFLRWHHHARVPIGFSARKLGAAPRACATSDEISRDGYSRKKVPDELDVIVIGSGIGGLTCAAMLSRAGKRCLVLEQHYIAGGSTHVFEEGGVEFDTGVHYIGNVHKRKKYLDLVTEGTVEWDKMGDNAAEAGCYDEICVGSGEAPFPKAWKTYKFRAGDAAFVEDLAARFPAERAAIEEYVRLCREVAKKDVFFDLKIARPIWLAKLVNRFAGRKFFEMNQRTALEVIQGLTADKDLQAALLGQFGDYGKSPKVESFFLHASIAAHYFSGGWFPRGGSGELAKKLIPTIERAGGRVLVRRAVDAIVLDAAGARAVGVRVKGSAGGAGDEIFAPTVISAAGVFNTYRKLLPPASVPDVVRAKLEQIGESCSMIYLFVRMKGEPAALGLRGANIWHWPDRDYHEMLERYYADPLHAPMPMFIGFPCAKDSTWTRRYPGVSNAVILTMAKFEWFEQWEGERQGKRGAEYDAKKKAFEARILEGLYHWYPQLKGKVDFTLVGSPLTFNHYIGSHRGEVYGLESHPDRFANDDWLRPQTPTKGLFLTGQDVTTLGVTGALMSGVLTAHAVLGYGSVLDILSGRNLVEDLWHLDAREKKKKSKSA